MLPSIREQSLINIFEVRSSNPSRSSEVMVTSILKCREYCLRNGVPCDYCVGAGRNIGPRFNEPDLRTQGRPLLCERMHRILKLAPTIADLARCEEIGSVYLAEALHASQPSKVDAELNVDSSNPSVILRFVYMHVPRAWRTCGYRWM